MDIATKASAEATRRLKENSHAAAYTDDAGWYFVDGIIMAGNQPIADTRGIEGAYFDATNLPEQVRWANGRLLAAAPEMRAELERLRDVFQNMIRSLSDRDRTVFCPGTIAEGLELNIASIESVLKESHGECLMNEKQQFYVEIVDYTNDSVVKRLGPMSERKADKVDDGLNINLDHNRYYTRIVSVVEA